MISTYRILVGDCRAKLAELPSESVQTVVTSPPYWGLRDYGVDGQIGLERTPYEFVAELVSLFREVRRVLRPDGTLWLNLGDCYATGAGSAGNSPGGALGYRKLITYTLATENGASLRASGFREVAKVKAEVWHRPSRPRVDTEPAQAKLRWEAA